MELAKSGMAQVVLHRLVRDKKAFLDRRSQDSFSWLIYQEQLLKAQDEAKKKKLGIWSK